jgi:hypothetical protein
MGVMANRIGAAVDEATRLDDIGFPEFTTKLITDVFDALVATNIRQMEAFTELLGAVGQTLTEYINDTKDDIDGAQVLQFLSAIVPADDADGDDTTKVRPGGSITAGEADRLSSALAVPGEDAPDVPNGALNDDAFAAITEAVARRIAANKYDLLQEMVRQGMLRLVVENGTIETRLTFTTYANASSVRNASTYSRTATDLRAKASTGSLLSKWVNASASASRTSVRVRSTSQQDRDSSGSHVQIYGGVKINFKTDFLPLNA